MDYLDYEITIKKNPYGIFRWEALVTGPGITSRSDGRVSGDWQWYLRLRAQRLARQFAKTVSYTYQVPRQ